MFRAGSISIVLAAIVSGPSAQLRAPEWSGHVPEQPTTEFTMAIELEKARFLQDESIFVWCVTELASGERRPIPENLLDDRRIVFARPDGSIRVDRLPVRIDGWPHPGARGSRWKWILKGETPQLGRWSVTHEMGSHRSAPANFTVEAR